MGRVRRKHSREFKFEAVKALRSGQHNTTELARRLGVTESHLRDWDKEYEKHGQDAFPGQGRRSGQAGELARLSKFNLYIVCPDCKAKGVSLGWWVLNRQSHVSCEACGRRYDLNASAASHRVARLVLALLGTLLAPVIFLSLFAAKWTLLLSIVIGFSVLYVGLLAYVQTRRIRSSIPS